MRRLQYSATLAKQDGSGFLIVTLVQSDGSDTLIGEVPGAFPGKVVYDGFRKLYRDYAEDGGDSDFCYVDVDDFETSLCNADMEKVDGHDDAVGSFMAAVIAVAKKGVETGPYNATLAQTDGSDSLVTVTLVDDDEKTVLLGTVEKGYVGRVVYDAFARLVDQSPEEGGDKEFCKADPDGLDPELVDPNTDLPDNGGALVDELVEAILAIVRPPVAAPTN